MQINNLILSGRSYPSKRLNQTSRTLSCRDFLSSFFVLKGKHLKSIADFLSLFSYIFLRLPIIFIKHTFESNNEVHFNSYLLLECLLLPNLQMYVRCMLTSGRHLRYSRMSWMSSARERDADESRFRISLRFLWQTLTSGQGVHHGTLQ